VAIRTTDLAVSTLQRIARPQGMIEASSQLVESPRRMAAGTTGSARHGRWQMGLLEQAIMNIGMARLARLGRSTVAVCLPLRALTLGKVACVAGNCQVCPGEWKVGLCMLLRRKRQMLKRMGIVAGVTVLFPKRSCRELVRVRIVVAAATFPRRASKDAR